MPIYKIDRKKDGLQGYRVRVNYTDIFGEARQVERVAYGKEQAKELERQLELEVKNNGNDRITLQQLYNVYIEAKTDDNRETTTDKTQKLLSTFVLPELGKCRLCNLTPPILQIWKNNLGKRTKKDGQKFALKYKQNIYGEFRTMLNYAVKMQYIEKNPLSLVGNFKDTSIIKKEMDFYTAEEFLDFLSAARTHAENIEKEKNNISEWNYYVFFAIAFYLGPRKGEIYASKWTDLLLNYTIFDIKRSISQKLKGGDRETAPKNKSSIRAIRIPLPLQKILQEHYERYKKIPGFSDDWRICGGQRCVRDSTVSKRNEKYAKAANIKKIRVHDFRHSHASVLINEGINIKEISRRLGHSNVEITWNTYSHLYPREEDRALNVLNKIA